ncbi:segregation and condensation protein A [Streptomyces pactum]|uniref:segregation and condensation protein A n=1 Tax=Streptomyces pactum TaxID=68249 RepID=UPI0036FD900A
MPTHDDEAATPPARRAPRRALGRGPGGAPRGAGPGVPHHPAAGTPGPAAPADGDTGGAAPEDGRPATAGEAHGPSAAAVPDGGTPPAAPAGSGPPYGSPADPAAPEVGPSAAAVPDGGTPPTAGEADGPTDPAAPPGPEPGPGPGVPAEEGPGSGAPAGGSPAAAEPGTGRFTVRLDNFEGPFDLLLQLISRHRMDVTEVALSRVTDEFMAHIRAMGPDWDLDQTTEFLVVAATLLDLKAARLLPAAEVEDEADLALLEARDLLFARLLQYRAYKRVADIFGDRLESEARRHPRTVGLEPHHADLLPEVVLGIGAEGFARLAVKAMQPRPEPQVYVDHIHAPLVSVREQAQVVIARLREAGEATFAELAEDAPDTLTVVARFLALLELYREKAVVLDQPRALGTLLVRWAGDAAGRPVITDEFDRGPDPEEEQR